MHNVEKQTLYYVILEFQNCNGCIKYDIPNCSDPPMRMKSTTNERHVTVTHFLLFSEVFIFYNNKSSLLNSCLKQVAFHDDDTLLKTLNKNIFPIKN